MSKSVAVIEGPLTRPEKSMLKQYEGEVEEAIMAANASFAEIGKALADILNEQLYRTYGTFAEYVYGRFGIKRSKAYRCMQIHQHTLKHPELPPPSQWELEPAKVAKKSAPKPAVVPPVGQEPTPVLDVEGWEEPAPAAIAERSEAQSPADFAASADAVRSAIEAVERVQEATENVETSSLEAPAPAVTAQSPDRSPVAVEDEIEQEDLQRIASFDAAWAMVDQAQGGDELAAFKAVLGADVVIPVSGEAEALALYNARQREIHDAAPPTPTAAWKHLLDHLQDCDPLDMAAVVSDDGYQIWVEWNARFTPAVAKRFAKAAASRKAAVKKVAFVKAAAKDTGGCDHPKVAGHPAKTRGKWACGLCNQEIDVDKVSA